MVSATNTLAIDASYLARERAGIDNFLYQVLPRLAQRWGPQDVAVFAKDQAALPELPDNATRHPAGGVGWTQLQLARAVQKSGAAVFYNAIPIVPIFLRLPCPAVVTVHDLHEFRARWGYVKRLLTRTFQRSAEIICVSEATRQDLLGEFPEIESRCSVVHEGADPSVFHRGGSDLLPPSVQALRIHQPFLLAVGTVMPRKNYTRLIRAYARLDPSAPPLVIVGRYGANHDEVLALPADLGVGGRVIFTGHLRENEVGALMRQAEMLCALSTGEGFGLPLVEAMHSGLPILASDIPPFREVAGHAARYVSPLDEAAIAAGIRDLLADGPARREMGEVGLRRRDLFSWDRTADQIAAVLRRAAGLTSL